MLTELLNNPQKEYATQLLTAQLAFVLFILILWHVDPLLGNDHEIGNYTTAVAK
jgi:hypothetical protein